MSAENAFKILHRNFQYDCFLQNLSTVQIFVPVGKEQIVISQQIVFGADFDDYILFEANMRGYNEIKSWILSMGSNVKVIEPENLKMDIIEDLKLSLASYSK